jgi:hypothetical protein
MKPQPPGATMSLRLVADWEARVERQKQLIDQLEQSRLSTHTAKAELRRLEEH